MKDVKEGTAEQLQTALDAREKAAFIAHINNCKDFNLVFDFTIQCAELARKRTGVFSALEKDKLEDMMACGLQRMLALQPYSWDITLAALGHGRKPDQLIICAKVIEGYFFDSAREELLKFCTEVGFTLGYVLWKCCPNMMDPLRFPRINSFISEHIKLYINDAQRDLRQIRYNFFFDILSFGIRRKLITDDYVLKNYGEYVNALFQYWCKVRSDAKRTAVIILSQRMPVHASKDIRKHIARLIMRDAHMKTCAIMDDADIYSKIMGTSIAEGLRAVCRKDKGNTDLVRVLLDADPDGVNKTTPYGTTPLHLAAQAGHIEIVHVLLEKGADVNKKNEDDLSPFDYALAKGSTEVVRVLLNYGLKITPKDKEAAKYHPEIFELLVRTEIERAKRKHEATIFAGISLGNHKAGIFASKKLEQLDPVAMRLIGKMIKASSAPAV